MIPILRWIGRELVTLGALGLFLTALAIWALALG